MAGETDKDVDSRPGPQAQAPQQAQVGDLTGMANATGLGIHKGATPVAGAAEPAPAPAPAEPARKLALAPVLLAFNTVLVLFLVGALVFLLLHQRQQPQQVQAAPSPPAIVVITSQPACPTSAPADAQTASPAPAQPVTWEQAEHLLAQNRHAECLPLFQQLWAVAKTVPSQALVADFFGLRVAQCGYELGQDDQASQLLALSAASGSPTVAAASNYYRAILALKQQHYHSARLYAYQALAALGCLETNSPMESDCDYLIAMAYTRQAMACSDQDLALIGPEIRPHDLFARLDRQGLLNFLREGGDRLNAAALGPAIWRLEDAAVGRRWVVNCTLTPLEDILQRFASQANLSVEWDQVAPPVRTRAVSLFLQGAGEQRVVEVAAGLAGLTARYHGQGVSIHDIQSQASLDRQRELLTQTGITSWRRFALRYPDDPRIGRSHFGLACLLDASGESAAALNGYQVLARRYPADDLAPSALLQSAMLRIRLRDYSGARGDLLDLLDRHPSVPAFEQVYLRLGQATYQSGMTLEAMRVYTRLYHLDVPTFIKLQACLGAAQCCFDQKDYPQTIEWVKRYRDLYNLESGKDLAAAYVVRAQAAAAMDDVEQAREYFSAAMAAGPSRQHYAMALLELAKLDLQQGQFSRVLGALGKLQELALDPEQRFSMLVISARAHRAMGLAPLAARTLRSRIGELTDPSLQAQLQVEYARCLEDSEDVEGARAALEQALSALPIGPAADAACCDLARLCLKTGRIEQAVTLAQAALARQMDPDQRRRALEILGSAFLQRKQYPQAVEAFSGLLAKTQGQAQP